MVSQKREPLSKAQIISISSILLAMGVTWTAVVFYRFNVKSITGEWGNLVLASVGLGFGFSVLYAGLVHKRKMFSFAVLGIFTSTFLLIAMAYYSEAF
ncbi:Uncharacterised protein [Corynebacterium kutscheri]|uniref:Uncharacterized protein n=1 Tax=Corynebacterium kutscheri TaxID=35755 RepID=A0A0F6R2G0_9CORY|nr:hypothetical protein UL82_07330 [Corynebacterium kutscheri]VEH08903.1 Uncharacterised protein [Corynebacterium kutscheri]VEH09954.1 Uncharacterised protein [Corynebacterium kutscheri]VEH80033.1 Uncharacterised protein [Corynebacterium kutscheri]